MKKVFLLFFLAFAVGQLQAQECLNVKFKLRGYFYAGTAKVDTAALGGFYEDKNRPKMIGEGIHTLADAAKFQLIAKSDSLAAFEKRIQGFKVFVVNLTDTIVELRAQDSRLNLKRQVFYHNQWQDIEYLPTSWCGNSYHSVFINPGEYWDFTAPCLVGKIPAKFRFVLRLNDQTELFSNEFEGSFNRIQLTKEQGHRPSNIMDPYDN